jgi:hypothetical protein
VGSNPTPSALLTAEAFPFPAALPIVRPKGPS